MIYRNRFEWWRATPSCLPTATRTSSTTTLASTSLIIDLLNYSRVGTRGKSFQPVNCEATLERVLASLKLTMRESGTVVTHDPLPTVMGDDLQLGQLFQNLLANATKFRSE